ncbi:unnamed protein product, partial [Urochloa humidicola]
LSPSPHPHSVAVAPQFPSSPRVSSAKDGRGPGSREGVAASWSAGTAPRRSNGEQAASPLPLTGCERVDSHARIIGAPSLAASDVSLPSLSGLQSRGISYYRMTGKKRCPYPDLLSERVSAGIEPGGSDTTHVASHNSVQSVHKLQAARLRER